MLKIGFLELRNEITEHMVLSKRPGNSALKRYELCHYNEWKEYTSEDVLISFIVGLVMMIFGIETC